MEKKQSSTVVNGSSKVKLLCSYGGKIQPRPSDHQLSYVGGDTKILAVDPTVKFSDILSKLITLTKRNDVSIKYQLPGEDLDALVSLVNDEDVEHMMVEYARMQGISTRPPRLRVFVFDRPGQPGPVLPLNPDYLFGFDEEYRPSDGPPLDLLQIQGIFEENKVIQENRAAESVVVGGGACGNAQLVFVAGQCMVSDSRERAVYGYVPIMPSFTERRMIASGVNNQPVGVNRGKF